ncbi:MAG: hypothetical protein DRP00_03030 [Candidatus Aenigmatarchaeota archaeon]|nr:MAG: hypothetical protein DRP00_03030 [Candidatus Aenigmarchaeota archaeon]
MPWGWGGRGYRWMFWLTGLPGWLRFGYPGYYPGYYPAMPFWFWRCRWFPWLPRWWWTGMYGPIQWTPSGPVLAQQARPTTPATPTFPAANEIEALKQQKQALEQELKAIEEELKYIEERLKQLGEKQ